MAKKEKNTKNESRQASFQMPTLFGFSARSYIPIFFYGFLALLFFGVTILPGILNHGSYIEFSSNPMPASIFVDDIYLGVSPGTYFVPSGEHTIRLSYEHFDDYEIVKNVHGSLFLTLFFPYHDSLQAVLDFDSSENFIKREMKELSYWELQDTDVLFNPQAPVIENLTHNIASRNGDLPSFNTIQSLLIAQIDSPDDAKDSLLALWNLESNGIANPLLLLSGAKELLTELNNSHDLQKNLLARTDQENGSIIEAITKKNSSPSNQDEPLHEVPLFSSLALSRLNALFINENLLQVPISENNSYPFYILNQEISRELFDKFLEANPQWSRNNLEELLAYELVDKNYLIDEIFPSQSENPLLPVRSISYYAAQSFIEWLEQTWLDDLSSENVGWELDLPRTYELLAAQQYYQRINRYEAGLFNTGSGPEPARVSSNSLYGLEGNLWEWTSTWYFPEWEKLSWIRRNIINSLRVDRKKLLNLHIDTDELAWSGLIDVRGGSWISVKNSQIDETSLEHRGRFPVNWSSSFSGFRIVLRPLVQ